MDSFARESRARPSSTAPRVDRNCSSLDGAARRGIAGYGPVGQGGKTLRRLHGLGHVALDAIGQGDHPAHRGRDSGQGLGLGDLDARGYDYVLEAGQEGRELLEAAGQTPSRAR